MTGKQILYAVVVIAVLLGIVWILSLAGSGVPQEEDFTVTGEMESISGSGAFTVNPEESDLQWTAGKTLIANYTDTGSISVESGSIALADGTIASAQVVFDMNSIEALKTSNTQAGVETLTNHLKSDDFFAVAQFPTATLEIASVTSEGDSDNRYTVNGTLTMKGIANPVTFPAAIYMNGEDLIVDARVELDRTLWDVRFGSGKFFEDLGDNVIDDVFSVDVHLVAEPSSETTGE